MSACMVRHGRYLAKFLHQDWDCVWNLDSLSSWSYDEACRCTPYLHCIPHENVLGPYFLYSCTLCVTFLCFVRFVLASKIAHCQHAYFLHPKSDFGKSSDSSNSLSHGEVLSYDDCVDNRPHEKVGGDHGWDFFYVQILEVCCVLMVAFLYF